MGSALGVDLEFLIAGRPNSGKSSLFNLLAGGNQKVGNYSGCTVEKKTAEVTWGDKRIIFTDLPGIFSLKPNSVDEEVALGELDAAKSAAHVLTVLDGNNLRQEVELPLLLKRQGYSVIVAVNMMDEVRANKQILNLAGMTELAGIPFFGISARTGEGVDALRNYLRQVRSATISAQRSSVLGLSNAAIVDLLGHSAADADRFISPHIDRPAMLPLNQRNDRIDRWLTHRIFGPIVFLAIMFFVFQSIFNWANPLSDLIEGGIGVLAQWIAYAVPNEDLASFLSDGILGGVGSVLVFVPQIAILFTLIAILELSGYLPRAAYMIDRILKPYGLDGKVFVPLLSSVACAVPGIMAARTVDNPRNRLVTILISPLMTCSARLPVYTLLIATFVPARTIWGLQAQGLVMAGMYLLGIAMALAVAMALKWVMQKSPGRAVDFLHLPYYRWPNPLYVWHYVRSRVWLFLRKAGTIIAGMAIILWVLLSFPRDHQFETRLRETITVKEQAQRVAPTPELEAEILSLENALASHRLANSAGGQIGQFVAPLFQPLGYDWKLSLALLASLAAREVFVSTLGTIFALGEVDESSASLVEALRAAEAPGGTPAYTLATCLSLLVFFAFSLQCISTIGVARRETNSWRIPALMFVYMFCLAYTSAFLVYQTTIYFSRVL